MTATATTPADIINSNAATPPEKVVDMATGQTQEKPAETPASGDKPESPEKAVGGDQAGEPTKAPATPPAEPSRLDKAREVARAKYAEAQRRLIQQAQEQRRQAAQTDQIRLLEAERARANAAQAELERLKDPMAALGHLEKIGLPAKVLAERAVAANTPEARLQAQIEARIAEKVAEVQKQYESRLQTFEQQQQEQRQAQIARAAEQQFLHEASSPDTFPALAHVAGLGDEWKASIVEEGKRIAAEAYRRTGIEYTNAEILSFMDRRYAKLVNPQSKAGDEKSNGASTAQREAQSGTGANETNAGSPRTLTNKVAQEKGTLPPNFDSLSEPEQTAILAAQYRALRRT